MSSVNMSATKGGLGLAGLSVFALAHLVVLSHL